uniref:Bifunctional inhibitor/plant lipid transfer protein/seed storage helical domain-containing protein n=1 Tax=Oryza punctata TaxID=4537 RepID=A0A0E0LIJ4_ORYPU
MASSCFNRRRLLLLLLLTSVAAAVLLSCLTVAATAAGEGQCQPGEAFPHNPLSGCRGYVISRACPGHGPRRPEMAKARCCRELAAVPPRCRCEALRLFMDGVGELRGCPREAQRAAALALMAAEECDLRGGSGETGRCYWPWLVGDGDVPMY